MKSLYLKSGKIQDVFNELGDTLNGTLVSNYGEHNLAFHSDFAKGNITGISFPEGMSYLHFDLIFRDDIMISMESLSNSLISFVYCSEGAITHSIGTQGIKNSLNKSQTGILKTSARINSILYFEKNVPLKFSIIGIETNKIDGTNDNLIAKLKNTYFNNGEDLMHIRFQDSKIAEKIEEFNTIKQKGIVRNFVKKDILKDILKMEIEQHNDSFAKMSETITDMALRQIDEIKRVSNLIWNSPSEVFAFKFLTQKTELSQNKYAGRI